MSLASLVVCASCKRDDVAVSDAGTLKVHYARNADTRPCYGSFKCRHCAGTGYEAGEIGKRCSCAAGKVRG